MKHPETFGAEEASAYLDPPAASDHKYSRGTLGLRTGSPAYPGAAVLGAEAAWRTGIGLLQFVPQAGAPAPPFGLPTPAAAVLAVRPETVVSADARRPDAWVIGSGTEPQKRSDTEREALLELLTGDAPVVVDAGALDHTLLAHRDGNGEGDGDHQASAGAPLLLTPHAGEFTRLCGAFGIELPPEAASSETGTPPLDRAGAARALATRLGATVLLKGSVTLVVSASGPAITVGPATPWLATAGTGDVLAGILGALAAAHARMIRADRAELARIAASGALLHDTAARIASGCPGATTLDRAPAAVGEGRGRPITALDVAHALPAAVALVRAAQPSG